MQQFILSPPWLQDEAVQALLAIAHEESLVLRFVGGCVRDTLMERVVGDIDIATPHPPEQIVHAYMRHAVQVIPTGIKHGTVTVRLHGVSFEITTLRRDTACDGRHAQVEFVEEWEEDARRRDFTMNALMMDAEGIVVDYVGGIADAQAGLLRFIGDANARIQEDYLRILRFFRFYATHGTTPLLVEELAACRENREGLTQLSRERIAAEMQKLFMAEHPLSALALMQEMDIWEVIAQGVEVYPLSLEQLIIREDYMRHTSEGGNPMEEIPAVTGMISYKMLQRLIAYAGDDGTLLLCSHWKLPKKMQRFVQQVQALPMLTDPLAVRHAVEQCGGDKAPVYAAIMLYSADEAWQPLWDYANTYMPLPCPITGDTLLAHGFEGVELRYALQQVRTIWVESDGTASTEKLLEAAKKLTKLP